MHTEFVVIGGGITGLAAAWALTRRGRDVVVLEQAAIGERLGGSHGPCRVFRLGYDDPAYVTLAGRARELWTELEHACAERLLHPTPQLTFGPQMPQVRAAMNQAGAACQLLSAGEAAERFPVVSTVGQVLLEPASAVIAADRALSVLAALAGGVQAGQRVTAVADDGRRVTVTTSAGVIEAGRAIVCAGPWTASLLAAAGIAVPGNATLEQVAYVAPASPGASDEANAAANAAGTAATAVMPIFVHYGEEFLYGLPVPGSDRYKIGIHHGGPVVEPDRLDYAVDAELSRRIEQEVTRRFLPGFDPRPVAVERCVYDDSPDTDFIVDRIGNVVVGSGTSGHGFKFGPLLGEWLAFLATGADRQSGSDDAPPARFALTRFSS